MSERLAELLSIALLIWLWIELRPTLKFCKLTLIPLTM